MADRFTVPQRAAEGVLDNLPADVAGSPDQYLPFAWAETQYKGGTYALPFDTDARALWYNIDMIKAAGQDTAQLDITKGAPTIDTVTKIADAINREGRQRQLHSWRLCGPAHPRRSGGCGPPCSRQARDRPRS